MLTFIPNSDFDQQTVADQLQYIDPLTRTLVLQFLARFDDETVFYEVSVDDLLWGYEDELLKQLKIVKPDLVPETTFGIFVGVSITHYRNLFFVFRFNAFFVFKFIASFIFKFNANNFICILTSKYTKTNVVLKRPVGLKGAST